MLRIVKRRVKSVRSVGVRGGSFGMVGNCLGALVIRKLEVFVGGFDEACSKNKLQG